MLDERMQDAFNSQINWELYSGYLYLSMASKFADMGMSGGQSWMTVQYQEELAHARIMFSYVLTRGGRVLLDAIEKPESEWPSGLAMFEEALAHEEGVTARIHEMASLALELKDHATYNFLQWFIRSRWRKKRPRWTWSPSSRWPASTRPACTSSTRSSWHASTTRPRRWWRWTLRPAPTAPPAGARASPAGLTAAGPRQDLGRPRGAPRAGGSPAAA